MNRFAKLLATVMAVFGALCFASGCSQIPQRELFQYRAAFAEVEAASIEILVDFADAVEAAEEAQATSTAPAVGAHHFSTELNNVDGSQVPDVEVRRLALRTMATFNDALATLAEGKSIESVRSSTGAFVDALGRFVHAGGSSIPGLSAVTGTLETVAALAEESRVRREFEAALRTGAPIVRQILTALIAERSDHLDLRRAEANLAQVDIIAEIQAGVVSVIALFESRAEPAEAEGEAILADIEAQLNEAIAPARLLEAVELRYLADQPAFDAADHIAAEQAIARIASSIQAYMANIEQYERLRTALSDYGSMLATTRTALDNLVAALDRPPNLDQVTEDMLSFAFSIKRNIEALRAARTAVK